MAFRQSVETVACFFIVFIVQLFINEVDGLLCACDHCTGVDFCNVSEEGRCYTRVFKFNNTITRQYRCLDTAEAANFYCDTVKIDVVIECCDTDFCNVDLLLNLTLPVSDPNTSVSPSHTAVSTFISPSPLPSLVPAVKSTCYVYNSNKPKRGVSFCEAYSCYKLERLAKNGTITQRKQGCMDDCTPQNRNRAIRNCCNSYLCNSFPWQTTILPQVSTTTTTKTTILFQASTSITTTTERTDSSTIFHLPTTLPTSSKLSIASTYLISAICLAFVYVIIFFLVIGLIITICYKQRQVNNLKQSLAIAHKNPNKSFETLTSGGDSV